MTVRSANFKLVQAARGQVRDEEFPDARGFDLVHLVFASMPAVEIPDNIYTRSLRRPDGKCDALLAADLGDVRAEFFVDLFVASFAKEM